LAGEVLRQGVVVEGVKGVKYTPKPPGMYKNSKKRQFLALIDSTFALKTPFFYLKVLKKIYSQDIF
jgi:hypothetical protein